MKGCGVSVMGNRDNKGKSVIDFPNEYICVDIETTGLSFEFDEIIEVTAILVSAGTVLDQFSSLIRPNHSHAFLHYSDMQKMNCEETKEYFDKHILPEYIVELTGITDEMLLNAPIVSDVIPKLADFIGDRILVGHNVNFDINFLYDNFQAVGLCLSNDFIDTMRIARKLFHELNHHRLCDIAQHLNIEQVKAHRAMDDVITTIKCFEKMKKQIEDHGPLIDFLKSFKQKQVSYKSRLHELEPIAEEIDETNPIYEKRVVFTGSLSSMSRRDAYQLVLNLGGIPEDTITKKTDFLVVGNTDFAASIKNGKTNKMKKADMYRAKGQDILTLSENTFFQMLQ